MEKVIKKICTECGGDMLFRKISSTFCVNGKKITIDGIDAYVCEDCEEEVYTSEEARMIERVIDAIQNGVQQSVAILNLSETAELLRVSNQTVYNMIKSGRIKAYKIGREWKFLKSDIMAYMNSTISKDLIAAKGGETSLNDLEIIMNEIGKRKKPND